MSTVWRPLTLNIYGLEGLLRLRLPVASGGARSRRAGRRRPDEGHHRGKVRRRAPLRAQVDDGLRFRRGVLDLHRRNEKILVVTRKHTYKSPMRRCNRCERTRKSFIVRELYLFSHGPCPSCVLFAFLLLKEPGVLPRQIRSHDLLLGDEDRRPSCLDAGDRGRAKVVANELRVRRHVSSTLKIGL